MDFGRRAAPVFAPHPRPFPHEGGREKSSGLAPLPSAQRGGRGWGMGGVYLAEVHNTL